MVVLLIACAGAFASSAVAQPALDASFAGGTVTPKVFAHGKWPQVARDAALQSDGKVVAPISLSVKYGRRDRRPVVRYGADGKLDESYGRRGVAWVRLRGARFLGLTGISIQKDGGALVSGTSARRADGPWSPFVAKLTRSGKLDHRFGDHGATSLPASAHGYVGLGSAEQADDGATILASQDDNGTRLLLTRLDKNGEIDRGYADHGTKKVLLAHHAFYISLVDTRLHGSTMDVLIGVDNGSIQCRVLRTSISSRGRPVTTFGSGGSVSVPSPVRGADDVGCGSLAATDDGGVAVAGNYIDTGQDLPYGGFVFKLHADGRPDAAFGTSGMALTDAPNFYGSSAALLGDGNYLIAGARVGAKGGSDVGAMTELDPTGNAVPSFGSAGVLSVAPHGNAGKIHQGTSGSVVVFTTYARHDFGTSQLVKLTN